MSRPTGCMCCRTGASSKVATRPSPPNSNAAATARSKRREGAMNAVVDFPVKPEARPYLDAFVEDAREPQWLRHARRQSLDRFARQGFPTRRSENWRYLDLRPLEREPPRIAAPVTVSAPAELMLDDTAARLLLIDGRCADAPAGDLPAGVWFGSMKAAVGARPELARTALDNDGEPF